MVRLVRIHRRPGSFGDLWAGRLAVKIDGAQPVRGRVPVMLVRECPVWVQPRFLEDVSVGEEAKK